MATNADDWLDQVTGGAVTDLVRDLDRAAMDAARDGVQAAQQDHPYTDRTQQLTNTAHPAHSTTFGEADMVWDMEYASFVDKGTRRADPYPFTPIARKAAAASLERRVSRAIQNFVDQLTIVKGNRFI